MLVFEFFLIINLSNDLLLNILFVLRISEAVKPRKVTTHRIL